MSVSTELRNIRTAIYDKRYPDAVAQLGVMITWLECEQPNRGHSVAASPPPPKARVPMVKGGQSDRKHVTPYTEEFDALVRQGYRVAEGYAP